GSWSARDSQRPLRSLLATRRQGEPMTTATQRDYDKDMLETARAAIPEWDFVPGVVASDLVQRLRKDDPDLLEGWLQEHAVAILTDYIGTLLRRDRMRERRNEATSAFRDAADEAEAGDPESLDSFKVVYEIDVEHTRRRVADMTGPDHLYV